MRRAANKSRAPKKISPEELREVNPHAHHEVSVEMQPGHAPAACERCQQEFGAPMPHPPTSYLEYTQAIILEHVLHGALQAVFVGTLGHPQQQQDQGRPGTDKSRDHNKRDISPTSFDHPLCSAEPCRTTVCQSEDPPISSPKRPEKHQQLFPHDHPQGIDVSHISKLRNDFPHKKYQTSHCTTFRPDHHIPPTPSFITISKCRSNKRECTGDNQCSPYATHRSSPPTKETSENKSCTRDTSELLASY